MFPQVFGHEGAGVVEEVGADVTGIEVGDHVVLSLRSCRTCATCGAGLVGYCEQTLMLNYMGIRMDGSTTYTRDGAPVYGHFFGQSSLRPARRRVRRQLRRRRQGPRPDPGRAVRLRLPDRRRHRAQRAEARARGQPRRLRRRRGRPGRDRGRARPRRRHDRRRRPDGEPARGRRAVRRDRRQPGRARATSTVVDRVKELTGGGATYAHRHHRRLGGGQAGRSSRSASAAPWSCSASAPRSTRSTRSTCCRTARSSAARSRATPTRRRWSRGCSRCNAAGEFDVDGPDHDLPVHEDQHRRRRRPRREGRQAGPRLVTTCRDNLLLGSRRASIVTG